MMAITTNSSTSVNAAFRIQILFRRMEAGRLIHSPFQINEKIPAQKRTFEKLPSPGRRPGAKRIR